MEKIRIISIEDKFGKPNDQGICTPFWAIKFADGRSGTVWDAQIADYMKKEVGINGECEVEIKVTPQGYNNIRAINMDKQGAPGIEVNPSLNIPAQNVTGIMKPSRENSIIAQCMVKGAVELAKDNLIPNATTNNEDLGQFLCMAVNELVGAYNIALDKLDG